jgi:glycosyltransferase involved in cell wall biosynthesis
LLVGLFGRISNWKGQHILLEALSELPGVHGVLVGSPLFGEDIYEQGLRERASNPDLEGRIHFMGFRRDIPALMRAMDIIAHTSIAAEPFGLVIVEGMLAEKPVIATRAGGAMEIIEDGESGVLVTPGSIAELRDAICDLQTNAAKSERLAKAGRKRAEELFSLPTLLRGISSVLEDLKNG